VTTPEEFIASLDWRGLYDDEGNHLVNVAVSRSGRWVVSESLAAQILGHEPTAQNWGQPQTFPEGEES
jgi:hypothetical protein